MEQTVLLNKVAGLVNQASSSNGAGMTEEADARIEELRELLNLAHSDAAAEKERIEAEPG